jgi:hypothetical protein
MSDVGADGKSTQTKWDDQKMRNEIGISADVDRHKEGGEAAKRSNRALNDIGDFIHKNTPEVSQLEYLGSAAVHIYFARALNQVCYISQTQPLLDTHERVAGPAFTDLQKSMMSYYGRKTTKIRSGF